MVVAGCPGAAARGTCNVKTKVVFVIYTALTFTKLNSALPWSLILAPFSVGFLQYSIFLLPSADPFLPDSSHLHST